MPGAINLYLHTRRARAVEAIGSRTTLASFAVALALREELLVVLMQLLVSVAFIA